MSQIASQAAPVAPPPSQQPQPGDTPAGQVVAPPPATPPPVKFAGKYNDEQAFRSGINEARKAAGLDPIGDKVKLIGEDGIFATQQAAEKDYGRYTSLIKPKQQEQTPAEPLKIGGAALPETASDDEVMASAGMTREYISEQWTKNGGKLTDTDYQKLKDADPVLSRNNISLAQAKRFIDGKVQAVAASAQLSGIVLAQEQAKAAALVGGEDNLKSLLKAAQTFVPAEDRAGFDKLLGDPKTMKAAVLTLKQMQVESLGAGGSAPIVSGSPGGQARQKITSAEWESLSAQARGGGPQAQAAWARIMLIDKNDII